MIRRKRNILCIVVLTVITVTAVYFLKWNRANDEIYRELSETAVIHSTQEESEYISPIDFDVLKKTNPDIYAWIEIPGTDISYPIVQHEEDDDYYLNHTVEGKEGFPGSIYTQCENRTDFSKFNTIIYGHNMHNGTMFSNLVNYRDEEYFMQHREVIIYTPDAERTYQVFAAVVYDDRLIPAAFDERIPQERQDYLDSLKAIRDMNSHVLDDIEVTSDSQIVTLSTCIKGQPDNRFLVEAVLTDVTQ